MRKLVVFTLSFFVMLGTLVGVRYINDQNGPGFIPPPQKRVSPNQPALTINEALNVIDREELRKILYWLCSNDLEGRMSAKKGNDSAKDYLVQYFLSLGYETSTQEFTVQNLNNHKEQGSGKTANVIAMMPGNDPLLMHETVVMGAHFDHIGYGPSMSQTPNRREIHFGADDNASGTTALTGAAKALSKMRGKNKRRIVFIAFSAEEMGLIGAKYYVNNPKYTNTVFMINLDMVGRCKDNKVTSFGLSSFSDLNPLVVKFGSSQGLQVKATSDLGGGSDHAAFASKGIPAIFYHTRMHEDYHTPNDTPDKINYDGLTSISKIVAYSMWEVCENGVKGKNIKVNFDNFKDHR